MSARAAPELQQAEHAAAHRAVEVLIELETARIDAHQPAHNLHERKRGLLVSRWRHSAAGATSGRRSGCGSKRCNGCDACNGCSGCSGCNGCNERVGWSSAQGLLAAVRDARVRRRDTVAERTEVGMQREGEGEACVQ